MDLPILGVLFMWNYTLEVLYDWLLSLSVFSRFIHVVAYISISFFLKAR